MARLDPGASARWMARRAKQAAASLKAEYDAGKRGDDSPVEPIYPTPREQLQALQRLLAGGSESPSEAVAPEPEPAGPARVEEVADDGPEHPLASGRADIGEITPGAVTSASPAASEAPAVAGTSGAAEANGATRASGAAVASGGAEADEDGDDEAGAVAAALRRVDWQQVRAVTAERTGDAAAAMRSMAGRVDWGKVQPVAAQVSSALIAAVAAGRVPVGGTLGPLVAKALTDSGALAGRVGAHLQAGDELPPDFRDEMSGTG